MNKYLNCIVLLYFVICSKSEDNCPNKCVCKRSTRKDGPDWVKIKCGDTLKVKEIEELDLMNIANEIIQLNLSGNHLTTFTLKTQLLELQKLDISKNYITKLEDNQFIELPNLKKLDISENKIKTIELFSFANLPHLERLKLNNNQISTILNGTFDPLSSLKQLDISNNHLACDCDLLWLLDWIEKKSVKLISNPKCNTPQTFKGIPLKKLKIGVDIHCKSPASKKEIPIIELLPDQNQVVFEGDLLKLHCRAPSIIDHFDLFDSDKYLDWTWQNLNPKHVFSNVSVQNKFLPESGIVDSFLTVSKLEHNHTGIWSCLLISEQGNHSKSILVVVISSETIYCNITTTANNKGTYFWPRTVVNYTVTIPCESDVLSGNITPQKASYYCSPNGQWLNLNTSNCTYISNVTKILEQFSKLSLTKSSILESAKRFKNFTSDLKIFKDVMDLVYAVQTVENYVNFLTTEKELGPLLVDVLNNIMNLPSSYIEEANTIDHSCSKIIKALEEIAKFTPTQLLHKSNMALEEFPVKKETFIGMTCTWYSNLSDNADRIFHCATSSRTSISGIQDRIIEASLQIPNSLFEQLEDQDTVFTYNAYHILVSMFSNNKYFPVANITKSHENIISPVVGTKLANITVTNLTDPIYVMMKMPNMLSLELTNTTPVWWNPKLDNGVGGWTSEGCHLSHELEDNLVFYCNQMGYYGILQDITYLQYIKTGAKFKFSHPAIYVGSFTLFMSLLISIVTYLLCYPSIQMPKKTKHSLVNTWIAVCILCFLYVFGIYQTENLKLCQVVGLLLHYFTLSSLLWLCVGVNCMYKRLSKHDTIELQDDELPNDPPIQKPILGLYLVGWGIAMIVCGISGAVNMKEYSTQTYCFLNSGPPLSALLIPFTILLIFLLIFFLLIRCAIYNVDTIGHLSEGTQATENVDLDLLEPNFPNNDVRSLHSNSTKTASSEIEDPEHAPSAQLKAYIIFLFIYIFAWISCALATIHPFIELPYEEDIFSIGYAVFASALGSFTLFFYCIARSDVRTQWVLLNRWFRKKGICFRSRNISDTTQNVPQIQIQPLPLPPVSSPGMAEIHVTSRSSSRSSSNTKSNSHTSNVLKAAADLNGVAFKDARGAKINNVNLIVLHRQQYRGINTVPNLIENPTNVLAAEMFYNPHQSTVARKFFKKQKRNMMKHNNLGPRHRDVNSDTASVLSRSKQIKDNSSIDQSIFGTNSKVNNTNIHVEHIRKTKQRNPNILSDSYDECDINSIPVEKFVINAERLRKKDMLRHKPKKKQNITNEPVITDNNMRSVSQQCTLEYSSEGISDSILDKTSSPEKSIPVQNCFNVEINSAGPLVRRDNVSTENISILNEEAHYCKIDEAGSESALNNLEANENAQRDTKSPTNSKTDTHYEPSELSISVVESSLTGFNESVPRIYVNPSHDLLFTKRVQSRASSVSTSELDEIYQQIRRGPKSKFSHSHHYANNLLMHQQSPFMSDSEINSFISDIRYQDQQTACSSDDFNEKVETTV